MRSSFLTRIQLQAPCTGPPGKSPDGVLICLLWFLIPWFALFFFFFFKQWKRHKSYHLNPFLKTPLFYILTMQRSMEDLISLTRGQTHAPWIESVSLNHWTTREPCTVLSAPFCGVQFIHTVVQPSPPPLSSTLTSSPVKTLSPLNTNSLLTLSLSQHPPFTLSLWIWVLFFLSGFWNCAC